MKKNQVHKVERAQTALFPLLAPLGKLYSGLMRIRAGAYSRGVMPSAPAQAPSIAVGNIAWGGTGKTPVTEWLLNWAEKHGLKCAVLSRGYGGNPGEKPLWVGPCTPSSESGDEPLMLAMRHPEAAVLVDPSRRRALSALRKRLPQGVDLIVFDDAMQHLAVKRDINLVLLRPKDLLEQWDKVQPAGSWREGAKALERADAFLLRAEPESFAFLSPVAGERLKSFSRPVFSFYIAPSGLRRVKPCLCRSAGDSGRDSSVFPAQNEVLAAGEDLGKPAWREIFSKGYVLCSGVGSPEEVAGSATALLESAPTAVYSFPDHHAYSAHDFGRLRSHGLPVICTDKDAVKLAAFVECAEDSFLYSLEIEARFGPALFTGLSFPAWLEERLLAAQASRG